MPAERLVVTTPKLVVTTPKLVVTTPKLVVTTTQGDDVTAERISSSLHSGSYALLPKPTGFGVQESQSEASEAGVPALPELECSVGVMAYNEQANIAACPRQHPAAKADGEADHRSHRGGQRLRGPNGGHRRRNRWPGTACTPHRAAAPRR